MLVASRIPSFVVSTKTLLAFVVAMLAGLSRRAAWIEAVDDAMSTRSGYRLWTRLTFALSMLRTRLCREAPPPACAHTEPIAQLLEHVAAVCTPALGAPDDAFANAQLHFQRGLFD